jgi:hypothetical protein
MPEWERHDSRLAQRALWRGYVLAHLRLIVPNRTTADLMIQDIYEQDQLREFRFGSHRDDLILEDAELSVSEIDARDLRELKEVLPWIIRFEQNSRDLVPLFISLRFSEKAYAEEDSGIRTLLRVMALGALFASGSAFGKRALAPRLPKFIGRSTDLYAQYRSD